MNNIYGIEGQFIDEIEREESLSRATHPDAAHIFFLPFSVDHQKIKRTTAGIGYNGLPWIT